MKYQFMMFRIGQKVVCVDDDFFTDHRYHQLPKRGNIYTVAGYHDYVNTSIFLTELNNPRSDGGQHCFYAKRFRPLVEKKTDISMFNKLLKTKKLELV